MNGSSMKQNKNDAFRLRGRIYLIV